ncbi:MAG: PRC-barrel domain containing protein [Spirochaetaceae bacterium]|nr:MAG: PRC-barrel domain containing protein [Spirochaetaceae bacterium]
MYVRLATLRAARVVTDDGPGSVAALFVDADDWAIRFLAVSFDAGRRGAGHRSDERLVSPQQLRATGANVAYPLTASRSINTLQRLRLRRRSGHLPGRTVARLTVRYGLPPYWEGPEAWGMAPDPVSAVAGERPTPRWAAGQRRPRPVYPDARIIGSRVTSATAPIGRVSDLAIDRKSWRVRYLIVRLSAGGGDTEVLVSPYWTIGPPSRRRARMDRPADTVLTAPRFRPESITRRDERMLAQHYGFLVES